MGDFNDDFFHGVVVTYGAFFLRAFFLLFVHSAIVLSLGDK